MPQIFSKGFLRPAVPDPPGDKVSTHARAYRADLRPFSGAGSGEHSAHVRATGFFWW